MRLPNLNRHRLNCRSHVTWNNASTIADTLLFERGVSMDQGATYTWTTIPSVVFGALSYLDTQVPDGCEVKYRVTYSKGNDAASAGSNAVAWP